jgi:hypothetical protein
MGMRRIVQGVLGLIALSLAVWIGRPLYHWAHHHIVSNPPYEATPEILRDMPEGNRAIRDELAERVRLHFPDGMPEASLIAALREQGFTFWFDNGARSASLVQRRGYCLLDCMVHWDIGWERDGKGHAINIQSGYDRIGIPTGPFGSLFDTDPY